MSGIREELRLLLLIVVSSVTFAEARSVLFSSALISASSRVTVPAAKTDRLRKSDIRLAANNLFFMIITSQAKYCDWA